MNNFWWFFSIFCSSFSCDECCISSDWTLCDAKTSFICLADVAASPPEGKPGTSKKYTIMLWKLPVRIDICYFWYFVVIFSSFWTFLIRFCIFRYFFGTSKKLTTMPWKLSLSIDFFCTFGYVLVIFRHPQEIYYYALKAFTGAFVLREGAK